MNSFVRTVRAPEYDAEPVAACAYYSYFSGLRQDDIELYVREHVAFGGAPTNDGLHLVMVNWPTRDFPTIRNDVEGHVWRALHVAPDFLARVREGRREEKWYGTAGVSGYLRKPYGKGWVLVGDASYNRDPITAQGISDAFIDAEALVETLSTWLSGNDVFDDRLAVHESARNERVRQMYQFTRIWQRSSPRRRKCQLSLVRYAATRTPPTRFCLRSPAPFRCPISCRMRTSPASWLRRLRQRLHRQGLSERSVSCT